MRVLKIVFEGQLSVAQVDTELAPLEALGANDPVPLLLDVTRMTGYDPEARERFVAWNREHRDKVKGVAIITTNFVWRVVISAMANAASQRMMPFANENEARRWLDALPSR